MTVFAWKTLHSVGYLTLSRFSKRRQTSLRFCIVMLSFYGFQPLQSSPILCDNNKRNVLSEVLRFLDCLSILWFVLRLVTSLVVSSMLLV